jgi:hypothetical protein
MHSQMPMHPRNLQKHKHEHKHNHTHAHTQSIHNHAPETDAGTGMKQHT